MVQFVTNTGNTIKTETVSGDELYLSSPEQSELLNYVLVCPYKHLSESFALSPVTAAGLCGIYRLNNPNNLQSLASRYFPH